MAEPGELLETRRRMAAAVERVTGGNSDHAALLQSVLDAPDDDAPRLVLADWLEENGHPEHGEYIRIQLELEQSRQRECGPKRKNCTCLPCQRHRQLKQRRQQLGGKFNLTGWFPVLGDRCEMRNGNYLNYWGLHPSNTVSFKRGFVERAVCNLADAKKCVVEILAVAPVRKLILRNPWRDDLVIGFMYTVYYDRGGRWEIYAYEASLGMGGWPPVELRAEAWLTREELAMDLQFWINQQVVSS